MGIYERDWEVDRERERDWEQERKGGWEGSDGAESGGILGVSILIM
jgi:hypothetical protein